MYIYMYILGGCRAFLASGSDPTDDSAGIRSSLQAGNSMALGSVVYHLYLDHVHM